MAKFFYSICKANGACVTEGDDRETVIQHATSYFQARADGETEQECFLFTYDDDDSAFEKYEKILLLWDAPEYFDNSEHFLSKSEMGVV